MYYTAGVPAARQQVVARDARRQQPLVPGAAADAVQGDAAADALAAVESRRREDVAQRFEHGCVSLADGGALPAGSDCGVAGLRLAQLSEAIISQQKLLLEVFVNPLWFGVTMEICC